MAEGEDGAPCFPGPEDTAPMGSYTCDVESSVCLEKWEGPNYGITSFDNIGLAEVICAKQRNGPTGTVNLQFFDSTMRFENRAPSATEPISL